MKKTLCLVLGVLAMLMLPGRNVQAQGTANGAVDLSVRTLDRALLESAWLYAAEPNVDYFVDSNHLSDDYTGIALPLDSLSTYTALEIVDGFNIGGSADTSVYHNCFVVALDVNGRYYVLAGGNQIDLGVFQALPLFLGGDTINNVHIPMTSEGNILMGTPAVVRDNQMWEYTTFNVAMNWANLSENVSLLTFMDSVFLQNPVNVNRDLSVNQDGHPLVNNVAGQVAIKVNGLNSLNWDGNVANILAGAGSETLFRLADTSMLNLTNVSATAAGNVVRLENSSMLVATGNTFTTTNTEGAVVEMADNSEAAIDVVNFYGGANAILLAEGSHGVLHVLENTAANRMNGYTVPVNAYGYGVDNGYRLYARTLRQVADSMAGRTVMMAMDMPASVKDTIASPVTLQMGTYSIADTLRVENAVGPVVIAGGNIEAVTCSTNDAPLVLGIDSLGYLNPGFHTVLIDSGRYVAIDQIAGASVSIRGGKYGERYDSYLAPRHAFVANTESDAALFPWKIVDGYTVTWVNYDFFGTDTTILYNEPDNKIRPVFTPVVPDTNTIFLAWWADPLFTTPWDFLNDTLSGNDTLWAQWHLFDPLTEAYYYVRHNRIGIDAADTLYDTVTYIGLIGTADTIYPLNYAYYTPTVPMVIIESIVADTMVNINYVRDTFQLTWNLRGGQFDDGHQLTERLAWGTLIDYSTLPTRRGYEFAGWVDNLEYMPPHDHTVSATWNHTVYPLTWVHANDTVVYTGEEIDIVRATFNHDGVTDTAILRFFSQGDGQMHTLPRSVGRYTVIARPQDTVFLLGDSIKYFTIDRAPITVSGFEVENEKFYDGTDSATIVTMGTINGVMGNDEVFLGNVYAKFSDAAVGEGKSIIVYYGVGGLNVANYILDTTAVLVSTDGAIIAPFVMDTDTAASGISVSARGYCVGNDTIRYYLESGSGIPDEYNLIYSDDAVSQGFVSAGWQPLDVSNPGVIIIDVPATAASSLYTAKLVFRDSNHPTLVSDTSYIGFVVNLPETYTMPLFSDVIALVDTCHCFTDIRWFHSTDGGATWTEIEEAQGQYYYQEEGGLTGQYYVSVKMNGVALFSCPQDDVTTLLSDDMQPAATVNVYPNPATETANVNIVNSPNEVHSVRVMSIMGVEMENTTFTGDSYRLNLRGYANGSYTVSVDGIVVRVIKK